jgi:hypothetical protein
MWFDKRPSTLTENDDGDFAVCLVLLIAEILIGSDENIEARGLRLIQEISVTQLLPSSGAGLGYGVVLDQISGKSSRRSVVEEHEHLCVGDRWIGAMGRELQNRLNLFASDAKLVYQLIDAHILKIFEDGRYGHAGSTEYPGTAALAGDAFYSGAL